MKISAKRTLIILLLSVLLFPDLSNTIQYTITAAQGVDYRHVNTKPDEAPFRVELGNETISTLSGSISLGASDLSLPGRNGLGFTLSRVYDSGSSQLYQMTRASTTNGTDQSQEEKMFPIGTGWSWDISYLEINEGGKYLHLAGAGVFKINKDNEFMGYPWKDYTFEENKTVTVGALTSAYAVKSVHKINQYFDSQGKLIQISDSYNNTIKFEYSGWKLISITDAIGNKINITYGEGTVVLSTGTKTVTYTLVKTNGKDLLQKVTDPIGREIGYEYSVKEAKFSLVHTTPSVSNPYALLTGITYPTGAKSVIEYESTPTTRYIGKTMVNQVYRAKSREDQFVQQGGAIFKANRKDVTYPLSDMGSSYDTDYNFSVAINDGLSVTTYTNEKDYINEDYSPVYYNNNRASTSVHNGVTYTSRVDYEYDRIRRWPVPIKITETTSNSAVSATKVSKNSMLYDSYGNVVSSVDPNGRITINTYDENSHLLVGVQSQIDPSRYVYNEIDRDSVHGHILTQRVREGSPTGTILQETVNSQYDSFGNVTQQKLLQSSGGYITVNTEFKATAPYNGAFPTKITTSGYDVDRKAITVSEILNFQTVDGILTSYTDGKGNTTSYQYDNLNRATKVINPDSSARTINYRDKQNEIEMTDEMGIKMLTRWNPFGWKIETGIIEYHVFKPKAKFRYDAFGRVTQTEDAIGNLTSYTYDQWSRQNKIVMPDNTSTRVVYDDIGSTKTTIDSVGNQLKEYYDIAGNVLKKEEVTSTGTATILGTYTYDLAGNVLLAKDSAQNTSKYSYDALSRLMSVTNALNEITAYKYNMQGNMIQLVYPDGNSLRKEYDEWGRLIKSIDAKNQIETFYYDASNNMIGSVDRKGNRFKYSFNNRNMMLSSELVNAQGNPLPVNEKVSYQYDLAGKRKQMSDVTGTTSYTYNPNTSQLVEVQFPDAKTINYDYDANGSRIAMKDPFGFNTYYRYNANNQLEMVSSSLNFTRDYVAKYQYYSNGLLKQTTQGNGVVAEAAYNGLRMQGLQQKKSDGSVINAYSYRHDTNGNINSRTTNGSTDVFQYDSLNRISTSSQFNESYQYDSRGNRSNMSSNNPFDSAASDLSYDTRNRLTQVTTTDGKTVSYTYNGDGQLWERNEGGKTTRYYWDGDQIIAEAMVTGGTVKFHARYIRGKGLEAREDAQGKAYYLKNGHGDVVELRDSSGNLRLNQYDYDIFGNMTVQKELIPQPFKYSGEMTDSTTELQYLRARWYDPSIGRFVGEDTYEGDILNPLTLNLYTYVINNPLSYVDPSGNYCVSADGNWAHGNPCESTTSIEMGDNDKYYGSPIIKNGIITGYLGKSGPYAQKEFNYWEEFGKGVITGSADAILGKYVYTQLMSTKHEVVSISTLGLANQIDRYVFPSSFNKTIANLSKTAGLVSIGITGFEIYNDFQNYTGNDRYWAATLTVAGTGASIGGTVLVTVGLTAVTGGGYLVAIAAFGAGVAIGAGISAGVDYLKKEFLK
ncbi:RHS repeat-associated core domain-containing protein [Paenibacillus sp. NPDC057967]|uniref:RHS repeat-associated core domain-containing protein n=1 Tax=Paenibacillus sp. NPDC057967 TaxID=3346293 RepID=UPI0036D85544